MTKQDQHLTTAQLSALLDAQLPPEEQEQGTAHLETCEQCQQELDSLRQTVALLRALPQPQLPRSFVLPAVPVVTSTTTRAVPPSPRVRPSTPVRRSVWPSYVRNTVNVLSTLAAVVGIVLLLSVFLTATHGGSAGSSSAGTVNSPASAPNQSPSLVAPHAQQTTDSANVLTPMASPTTTPTQSVSAGNGNTRPPQSPPNVLNLSTAGSRALLGFILLILGIIGVTLGTRQRTRAE